MIHHSTANTTARKLADAGHAVGIAADQLRKSAELLTYRPVDLLLESVGAETVQMHLNRITAAVLVITAPELGEHAKEVEAEVALHAGEPGY